MCRLELEPKSSRKEEKRWLKKTHLSLVAKLSVFMDKNCQNIPTLMIQKSGGSISQEVIQLYSLRLCLSKITNIGLKTTKCY